MSPKGKNCEWNGELTKEFGECVTELKCPLHCVLSEEDGCPLMFVEIYISKSPVPVGTMRGTSIMTNIATVLLDQGKGSHCDNKKIARLYKKEMDEMEAAPPASITIDVMHERKMHTVQRPQIMHKDSEKRSSGVETKSARPEEKEQANSGSRKRSRDTMEKAVKSKESSEGKRGLQPNRETGPGLCLSSDLAAAVTSSVIYMAEMEAIQKSQIIHKDSEKRSSERESGSGSSKSRDDPSPAEVVTEAADRYSGSAGDSGYLDALPENSKQKWSDAWKNVSDKSSSPVHAVRVINPCDEATVKGSNSCSVSQPKEVKTAEKASCDDDDCDIPEQLEDPEPSLSTKQKLLELGLPDKLPKSCNYASDYAKWVKDKEKDINVSESVDASESINEQTRAECIPEMPDTDLRTNQNLDSDKIENPDVPKTPEDVATHCRPENENVKKSASQVEDRYESPKEFNTDGSLDIAPQEITIPEDRGLSFLMAFINTPHKFWIHLISKKAQETLDWLNTELGTCFSSSSQHIIRKYFGDGEIKLNSMCCAEFRDGNFYRGRVTALRHEVEERSDKQARQVKRISRVRVLYVDFGNHEWVSPRKIFPLPPRFYTVPPQAICCSLANIQPLRDPDQFEHDPEVPDRWKDEISREFAKIIDFENEKQLIGCVLNGKPGEVVR